MKKTFLLLLCCWFTLLVGYNNAVAQCTQYNAGPYSDQGIDVAGCTGTQVAAPYAAWLNELYHTDVVTGGTYTFELVGCNATAWSGAPVITAILNPTSVGPNPVGATPGNIVGGTILTPSASTACGITFTATETGTVYFVLSTATACGAAAGSTDNGVPTVTTVSGVSCDVCGNGTCAPGETYCNCGQGGGDCPCTTDDIDAAFIGTNATGNLVIANAGDPTVIRCQNDFTTGTPPANPTIYVTLAYFGGACIGQTDGANPPTATSPWATATADFGTVVNAPGTPLTTQPQLFIFFLELTQADINASGGTVTITFGDETAGSNCSLDFAIDLTAWGNLSTMVADNCVPCNDNAGTLTGPSQVCFNESFTINSVGATFDPASNADGILYGIFVTPGPSTGFENNVTNDPNFVGVLGDDSNSTILNNIFTDGGTAVIAPITYEGVDPTTQNYILGDCHHVGTGFTVDFIPQITIDGFLSCHLDITVAGGDGTGGYNYTLAGPSPATAQVAAGNTTGALTYNGAPGDYTLTISDVASGCTETFTVTIAANNDSPGDASVDTGSGAALAATVCYDGTYSIMSEGAVVGSDDAFFSNILGWGISTLDPAGDINAIDVAFLPTASATDILNFTNNGAPLTGAFNPDGTPFTGSLIPGNTYYFTPFTMFDLPGTPLGTQTPGTTFGANGDGNAAAGYDSTTGQITDFNAFIDVIETFYVDGADPTGAGFNISSLCLDITHPWVGDLEIYLLSPAGSLVQLFAIDPNSDGDNFTACFVPTGGTTFATTCADPNNCYTGNLAPANSMVTVGENPNGFWSVIINDIFGDTDPAAGGGTLNSWSATVSGGSIWDANGNFPFPVWDGACYLAGNAVEVSLLNDLDVVASSDGCNFLAMATGGDIVSGGTWEVTNAGGAVVASGNVAADGSLSGTLSADGNYGVVVTDQSGCQSADTFTISGCTVVEVCPVMADFTVSASQVCSGTTVTLCADVDLGTFASVGVVFSDGTNTYSGVSGNTPVIHTVQVGQGGLNFAPQTVNAQVGDIIRWVWSSGFHTTTSGTIPAGAAAWDHPLTGAGQQFDYTVTQVGTYNYFCTPHAGAGMTGTIVVSAAATATYCADVTLSNTSCQASISNFTATFVGSTIGGCANIVAGPLGVTTYPMVTATGTNGTCSASVTTNCPGFGVSYTTTGGQSGSGTSFTAEAGQSGTVTFTITQTGAPTGCATATAMATYNCPSNICSVLDGAQAVSTSSICSGGSVQYTAGGVVNNDFTGGTVTWVYGTTAGFNAYTGGTAFSGTLPANTSCNAATYFLKARLDGVSGCQDVSDEFTVMVYPAITATPQNGTCSAGVSVGGGCTGYSVSYTTSGGQSGSGTSFSVTPSTSLQEGTVTFTVSNANAPAGCNSATVEASYSCPALVCSVLNGQQSVLSDNGSVCSNTPVPFNLGGVVNNDFTGGVVAASYSTDANFDPYTEGTSFEGTLPANNTCSPIIYHIKFYLSGVSDCQDVSETFNVTIFPPMAASLQTNGADCPTFSLIGASVDCGYSVLWEDGDGNSGTGDYTPADGSFGSVTFSIQSPFIEQNPPSGCSILVFNASFNCSDLICSELDNGYSVSTTAICSGGNVSFTNGGVIDNDFTGGTAAWVYGTTAGFNAYSSAAQAFTGSLPANNDCTPHTYYIKARLNGVVGCQDVSQEYSVMVYPNISATVSGDECSATLTPSCNGFSVAWASSNGGSGSGTSYTATEGEAGTVTFTVTQGDAPAACSSATFTYDFDCPLIICSTLDGTQHVGSLAICSGGFIEYNAGGVVNNSFEGGMVTWVYSTTMGFDAYAATSTFDGTLPANGGCDVMTYYIKARLDGVEGCQDVSDEFSVNVWPAINASVMTSECNVMLMTNCPNMVTWTNLATGETGSSHTYSAQSGETATISFEVMQAGAPGGCSSLTLQGEVSCPDEPVCTLNEAGVCSLHLAEGLAGRLDVCAGDGAQANATGVAVNDANYEAGFILFSSPDGTLSNPGADILETNADGLFNNIAAYPTNTTLYICSAVLIAPFGSNYSGQCSAYSNVEEVIFYNPISISVEGYECNFDDDTYTVMLAISGGNGDYLINGNSISSTYTSDPVASGSAYTFMVMDSNGCMGSISGEYLCEMPQVPPVAQSSSFTISILAGASSYDLNSFVSDANGDPLSFEIVSVVPSDLGTLDFDSATGMITYTPNSNAVGQSVVVTFTVTDGMSDPVTATITLNVTDQLTCEILDPIVPHIAVTIDPTGNTYTYYLYASGGLPDVDHSSYFASLTDSSGFDVNNLLLPWGDVVMGMQPLDSLFTLTLTVTDALGCTATATAYVNATVPVELLSFTGEVLAEGNRLHWATASETNNHHFTLERSTDGINYQNIATLAAAGNSTTANTYAHLDKDAPAGLSYYRLSQTDFDGMSRYVGAITLVRGEMTSGQVIVSPVPAVNTIKVSFAAANEGSSFVNIYDVAGRVITTQEVTTQVGSNNFDIDVQSYAAGTYFISIKNAGIVSTAKFVKQQAQFLSKHCFFKLCFGYKKGRSLCWGRLFFLRVAGSQFQGK